MAKGLTTMLFESNSSLIHSKTAKLLGIVSFIFALSFSWYHIRDYFNINHPEIVRAGELANIILPKDAQVIAPYGGDTAFLYQINRRGWPIGGDIPEKIKKGATDYISVTMDEEAQMLSDHCRPTIHIENVTIINLRNCSL